MKYPSIKRNNINTKTIHDHIIYANRGMSLESDINQSNAYYKEINKALIYKKPTPIKISKVEYRNKGQIIKEAFFEKPSTTDYNGIYKGKYIDFEAKECKSATSFPLSNIHLHQINHILKVKEHGGISFLIIRFITINKTFLLKSDDLKYFLENEDRKSIPLTYFESHASLLKDGYLPRIDYLKVIDEIYGGVINDKEKNK